MSRRKDKTPRAKQAIPPLAYSQGDKAGVAAERIRPWLLGGMTALLVARPLFPGESTAAQGDGLAMVMLWLALGVFWLLGVSGRPTFSLRFGWTDAAVLLLVLWTTVASLWAVYHGTPRPAVNMLWQWIGLGLGFFLIRQFVVTPRERRAIVAVMIAVAVALAVYGLYQRWYEMPQTRAVYEADPEKALRDVGLADFARSPATRKLFEDRLANTEPMATFALTNSLAAFLTPWLVMLIGIIVASLRNRRRLVALAVCLIPLVVCLLLTKSRSGYAAVCVGAFLIWLFSRTRPARIGWKLPAAVIGVAMVLLGIAIAVEGAAVLGRASKSFGYRVQYWQSSLDMIAEHPWVGCGPGNFQSSYTQYKLPDASEEIADPHNFLLEIWATAGTPAALAFLAVLGCWLFGRRMREADDSADGANFGSQISNLVFEISDSKSQIPDSESSPDGWRQVLGGGAVGFLLAVPMGILSEAPPSALPVSGLAFDVAIPTFLLIGLPLAVATVAAMFGWIRDGSLPRWLPGVCVAALLVNLLAAGGIAFPGIAGSLWLLLALSLDRRGQGTRPAYVAWAAAVVLVALLIGCYATAYRPVLTCQSELRLIEREPALAKKHIEAAAEADPLSAEPWRQMAAIMIEAWSQCPEKVDFGRFLAARDKMLELAPNSAPLWTAAGDWASRAYAKTDQHGKRIMSEAVRSATECYGRAVQLYPNSALHRAKLAEAMLAAGDQSAARREAEMALHLDEITPHIDKKLSADVRNRLRDLLRNGERPHKS
jgi:O-antigen ligase